MELVKEEPVCDNKDDGSVLQLTEFTEEEEDEGEEEEDDGGEEKVKDEREDEGREEEEDDEGGEEEGDEKGDNEGLPLGVAVGKVEESQVEDAPAEGTGVPTEF
jgi:hypothetical protein